MNTNSFYRPVSGLDLLTRIGNDPPLRGRVILDTLARIEDVDPDVRAMTAVAQREAVMMASAAAAKGALAGMPIGVKDIFDTDDLVTSYGSPIYEGYQPRSDAAIVTLLRRNGGVIMGKTVTSEFAYMAPTATRNPCDMARTAGGSSSGSAAAVAAGMVPFAIGSQTGGSTIRPASFCGIAGYKPTLGMLPTVGMKCFSWSFDTVGLFAAGVRDVAYLAQVLSGRQLAVDGVAVSPVFGVPDSYPWTDPSVPPFGQSSARVAACGGYASVPGWRTWSAHTTRSRATKPGRRWDTSTIIIVVFCRRSLRRFSTGRLRSKRERTPRRVC